jgi:hypothetical protein
MRVKSKLAILDSKALLKQMLGQFTPSSLLFTESLDLLDCLLLRCKHIAYLKRAQPVSGI